MRRGLRSLILWWWDEFRILVGSLSIFQPSMSLSTITMERRSSRPFSRYPGSLHESAPSLWESQEGENHGNQRNEKGHQSEPRAEYCPNTFILLRYYLDAIRILDESNSIFTQWDYRDRAWEENNGVRIDHILLSPNAADKLEYSWIDTTLRNQIKPSDHVPVWALLSTK